MKRYCATLLVLMGAPIITCALTPEQVEEDLDCEVMNTLNIPSAPFFIQVRNIVCEFIETPLMRTVAPRPYSPLGVEAAKGKDVSKTLKAELKKATRK